MGNVKDRVGTLVEVTARLVEPKLERAFATVEFRMASACWFKHRGKKHPTCPKGLFDVRGYCVDRADGSVEVDLVVRTYGVIRDELIQDVVKRVEAFQFERDHCLLDSLADEAQRKVEEMTDKTQYDRDLDDRDLMQCEAWFQYHPPIGNQGERHAEVKKAAGVFARRIIELAPMSADRTAAIRKVREAMMTASAAIACSEVGTTGVRDYKPDFTPEPYNPQEA